MSRLIDALKLPQAYPHRVDEIELIQTHISWVLLAGEYAYKIRRPVKLGFVDFSTLESRRRDCFEELRLNRRFAPELYEAVVPIVDDGQQIIMDPPDPAGEPVEYAVKMRRFPAGQELSALLAHNAATADELKRFGFSLAAIHERLDPCGDVPDPAAIVRQNARELQQARPADGTVAALIEWIEQEWRRVDEVAAQRIACGRVRECHGDLHAANIVRLGGELVAFDCLEFDAKLRCIDVASDIAFLFMDLRAHGERPLAYAFLNAWLEGGGDYQAVVLLRFFAVHRAMVRAKVATLTRDTQSIERYRALAMALTAPEPPTLAITCGLSGSGKTWFSERAMIRQPAIRIRSDVERKRMAGLRAGQSSGGTIYTPQLNERVYAHLLTTARSLLVSGESAIVDAAFLRRHERDRFRQLAGELGVNFRILHCVAPQAELRSRIEARSRASTDASEADATVMERQRDWWEAFGAQESVHVVEVRTAEQDAVECALAGLHADARVRSST